MKPLLSAPTSLDREALAEAILREQAGSDPAYVVDRLRHVVAQLAAEGVFDGMGEAEVRTVLREAVADLGLSPQRGAN